MRAHCERAVTDRWNGPADARTEQPRRRQVLLAGRHRAARQARRCRARRQRPSSLPRLPAVPRRRARPRAVRRFAHHRMASERTCRIPVRAGHGFALAPRHREESMHTHRAALIALLTASALATGAPAQAGARHPYTLVDPGTFGGRQSALDFPGVPITPRGALIGTADTAMLDPSFPNTNPFIAGSDPYFLHAFAFDRRGLHD